MEPTEDLRAKFNNPQKSSDRFLVGMVLGLLILVVICVHFLVYSFSLNMIYVAYCSGIFLFVCGLLTVIRGKKMVADLLQLLEAVFTVW